MATLPTVPTFGANTAPSIATLNQMASAVSFVTQMPIVVSLKLTATQSVSALTSTSVNWTKSEIDSDGMHSTVTNPSRLTAQTQGWYKLKATVVVNETSAAEYTSAWFKRTTGSNNPAGSGQTLTYGSSSFLSGTTTSDYRSITISSMVPMYIGDYVEVIFYSAAACTIQYNYMVSGNLDSAGFGDGASCLYGYYLCEGP